MQMIQEKEYTRKDSLNYIEENKERFLAELFDFLRIPSVSTDQKFAGDIRNAAKFIKTELNKIGVDHCAIMETAGHPVVYAEYIKDTNQPTVLVYGHYDVQPADPYELWDNPPFDPIIKNEKIYARGACDDKGQMFMHLKALEIIKEFSVKCNIKFLFEGEEEVGSVNLEQFIIDNKSLLSNDLLLISDTAILSNNQPSLMTGAKGILYYEIEATGPNRDIHSGIFGGAVANPLNALNHLLNGIRPDNGLIRIPDFYKDVIAPSKEELRLTEQVTSHDEQLRTDLSISNFIKEEGYTSIQTAYYRPTFDVHGIEGGYNLPGAKTIIPSKAIAKFSFRLAANQNPETLDLLIRDYIKKHTPSGIEFWTKLLGSCKPSFTSTESKGYLCAEKAMKTTFNKEVIPTKMGGSLPIIAMFEEHLKVNVIMMGFGLDTDDIHSPNEHYGVFNFLKGIETIPEFFKEFYKA
jgi:acetylornithine deacetylase/succinyl-diaminopimelate desuccinylase-like protein